MTEHHEDHAVSIRAEQAVIGALLLDYDALDRVDDLEAAHFYRHDHRVVFDEIRRQVVAGQRADAMTVFAKVGDKVEDCLKYLAALRHSAVSAVNIRHHAEIIADKAGKRALVALGIEMQELDVAAAGRRLHRSGGTQAGGDGAEEDRARARTHRGHDVRLR
ncbi:DnaB-like helicase N-terminal domain-containing protein [Janthinobacterium fluminis]|uniref:DnaB-like helicase N-terminal domain-containing protein n=1 Tax=Janthinobacterium fluminis TaxID=2987524 RepID=A0ABT5K255_9BURK|nr:DnaB-like helicase N-terminal domain-containing protein [Janthinobacterium fluminis]MDC8759050.1 DnaB-like helicase N-terminal domain-containing protein [Janthinobacterium fluminis]